MAIFATCYRCGNHIISYIDEWKDVKMTDGSIKRMKVDVWLHDIYDYDPEPDHSASPQTGKYDN